MDFFAARFYRNESDLHLMCWIRCLLINKAVVYFASLQSFINVGVIFKTNYFILVNFTFGIMTLILDLQLNATFASSLF